ncbi:Type I secretion outer membrane protein, TolC precursor [gamma proteobacterium IMCC1989]|nr:Type I secretion outer membrane protein, TolC precursor [gamma proteobacterium IMCC1989]
MNISFRFLSYPLTPVLIGLSLFNIAPLSYAQSTPQSYSLSEHQAYAESNEKRDTLIDIYDLAKINDHQLKSDHAEYLAGQEAAAISRSALRPQITGTASLSKTDADTDTSLLGNTSSSDTETDNTSYQISLVQQLLNANAWNTYEQGKVQTQLAEAQYKVSEQSLMIRSAQAYFDTLRAMDQLQTDIAEEKAQSTLLEQTRQRYEVGLISINDVHETQAAFDNAVASRINSDASVGIRLDALTVITGKLHNDIAPLKDTFVVVEPEPKNKQAWVDFALANNLELNVSALAAEVSLLGEKAAKSNHLPTLNGSISYTDSDSDTDSLGTVTNTDTNSAAFSLNFSMPLYTGGNLSALQRQAAQSAIQAREDWLFTQRSTIQSTRSLYLSVTTGIAQLKARKQAIISNESALSATKAGYDAGTRDIVDVVNAQSNLFQAQRNHLDTLYDYIVNTLLLKQAAGILQLSDIQSLNASLEIK